jgi:hypothetical protein
MHERRLKLRRDLRDSPFSVIWNAREAATAQLAGYSEAPEVETVSRHLIQRHLRLTDRPIGRFAIEHLAVRFAKHLDVPQRVLPVFRAEVEVV